ncbi:MAG TPA: hypothetical protein PLW02_02495, partial [Verrucomicrobiota bacterium]|nr:hypothetical protein [Verrucomicrobiota bacterium]
TIEAYNTIKTAALENFAKWGCFANTDGNPYVGTSFDAILLQEGRIDSRAADKIPLSKNGGTDNVYLEITQGPGGPPGPGYFLSGTQSGSLNTVSADYTVQIVIKNVSVRDARELSLRIDGPMLTATDEYSNDWQGRVAYTLFGTSQGDNRTLVWVYMYVAHR